MYNYKWSWLTVVELFISGHGWDNIELMLPVLRFYFVLIMLCESATQPGINVNEYH